VLMTTDTDRTLYKLLHGWYTTHGATLLLLWRREWQESTYYISTGDPIQVTCPVHENGVVATQEGDWIIIRVLRPTRFEVIWYELCDEVMPPFVREVLSKLERYLDE